MSRQNDLEGVQDQGGKHGGQRGLPKLEPWPAGQAEKDPDRPDRPDAGNDGRKDVGGAGKGS